MDWVAGDRAKTSDGGGGGGGAAPATISLEGTTNNSQIKQKAHFIFLI